MHVFLRWLFNALVLLVIASVVPGISVANFYVALIAVFVLALVNAVIRPIIILLTLPVNILTLGLFTLIINAAIFLFVSSIVKGFDVTGFGPAFWGALMFSCLSWIFGMVVYKK